MTRANQNQLAGGRFYSTALAVFDVEDVNSHLEQEPFHD